MRGHARLGARVNWAGFALASGLVILSATCLVSLFRLESGIDRLLAGFVLCVAQVQVSLLAAGLFVRALEPGPVLAINAAITAPFAVLALRRSGLPRLRLDPPRAWARSRSAVADHPWEALLVALAVGGLAWRGLLAYTLPPYGYDALTYHLPTVVTWVQEHGIVVSELSQIRARYPPAGELLFTWPVLFGDEIVYVNTVQVGFAAAGALAVGAIARAAGFGRPAAYVAGALFALTPVVLAQANTPYVDLVFASSFLLALYFIYRCISGRPSAALLLLAGLAGATVVGSKPNGLIGGLVLAVTAGAVLVSRGRRIGVPPRSATAMAAAFVAPLVLLGGWSYLRNWIEVGNPLWPARIELLGIRIFDGVPAGKLVTDAPPELVGDALPAPISSWAHDLDFWNAQSYLHNQQVGGLGPLWSWLGILLLVAFGVIAFKRQRSLLAAVLAPILVVTLLGPYGWWARFTVPLVAASALAIGWFWQLRGNRALEISLRMAVVGLAAAGLWIASWRIDSGAFASHYRPVQVLRLAVKPTAERSFGRVWVGDLAWLDRLHGSNRIAFGTAVPFVSTLAGPRLSNGVELLPRPPGRTGVHGVQHRVALPGQPATRVGLGEFITARGIDYVFVRIGTRDDRWARRHPRLLRVVSPGRAFRAYRVRAPR
jgi:hypothetical protein